MTDIDAAPAAPSASAESARRPEQSGSRRIKRIAARIVAVFGIALAACALVYLASAVPGRWFPGVSAIVLGARDLGVSSGRGSVRNDELFVIAPDTDGIATVVAKTDFRAIDYPALAWIVIDLPEEADVRVIWRSDYAPQRLNSVPVRVESGRLRPVVLASDPNWLGRITGVGLAIRAPLAQPVRVRGVVMKTMSALEVFTDRWREWFATEGWTGVSINSVTGGADVQDLPLPLLLFVAVVLSSAVVVGVSRFWPGTFGRSPAMAIAALSVLAWFALDLRWIWSLGHTVAATGRQYGGKDWREKHVAAADGPLFEFIERVRKVMPGPPQRVFVVADAHYFRGRAAYHLLPHNVWWDPWLNAVPPADRLRSGDWIVVYQRRGVQYDRGQQLLRWDGGAIVPVELKFADAGAALFKVR